MKVGDKHLRLVFTSYSIIEVYMAEKLLVGNSGIRRGLLQHFTEYKCIRRIE